MKEAKTRIKINKLLEEAGWRFFDNEQGKANVLLENHVKITKHDLDEFGEDFQTTKNGFVDFLLLDKAGFPFMVLEANAEDKNPLVGKEQARKYALSQGCRLVILSNGNQHYLWDIRHGSPQVISRFPAPDTATGYAAFNPNPDALVKEIVERDYMVCTQRPDYKSDPSWKDPNSRAKFLEENGLRMLRPYQVQAVHAAQQAVKEGKDRFLFEMATGSSSRFMKKRSRKSSGGCGKSNLL